MTKEIFEEIKAYALQVPFTSFAYSNFEDMPSATILCHRSDLKVVLNTSGLQPVIEYATDNISKLSNFIKENQVHGALHFVPKAAVAELEACNLKLLGEYADFFAELTTKKLTHLEFATLEDARKLAVISQSCIGESRGFFGEPEKWFEDWISEHKVIVKRQEGEIVGYCCVSIYNEGTTLWVRELAVSPEYHRQGYGQKLLQQGLQYGSNQGATKAFLAVDIENHTAIRIYEQYGFKRKDEETEIQMIRVPMREAAYAIGVNPKGELALIRSTRRGVKYFLPGGGIENNETQIECLHREIREETGYPIQILKFLGTRSLVDYAPSLKIHLEMVGHFYSVAYLDQDVCEAQEEDHFLEWHRPEMAINLLKLPHQVWGVKEFIKQSNV